MGELFWEEEVVSSCYNCRSNAKIPPSSSSFNSSESDERRGWPDLGLAGRPQEVTHSTLELGLA